jgi:hypothetical protein
MPSKHQTRQRHQHNKTVICGIGSKRALCHLLKIDRRRLMIMAEKPSYKTFSIPKKGGGEREIEAPYHSLKKVLSRLNYYLQSVYYFEKSSAAYGFIPGVSNDDDRRNVVTNAKKHLNKAYLLNIDLKDFFHTVSRDRVLQIFAGKPFNFKRDLPDLLADITTYKGRLPMGTPTSPVLSNFACRELDQALVNFAEDMLWIYTRYADDMSFSSNQLINAEKINSVRRIVKQQGFVINERKSKVFGPEDDKIVTGLLLTDKVSLAPDYLPKLEEEIKRLAEVMIAQNEQGQLSTKWVEQQKKQVRGRLNFVGFVLRRNDPRYQSLKDAFYTAINPPQEDFSAVSWRGFPYGF